MDYYKILNLKEDATIKEIEQAYLNWKNQWEQSSSMLENLGKED